MNKSKNIIAIAVAAALFLTIGMHLKLFRLHDDARVEAGLSDDYRVTYVWYDGRDSTVVDYWHNGRKKKHVPASVSMDTIYKIDYLWDFVLLMDAFDLVAGSLLAFYIVEKKQSKKKPEEDVSEGVSSTTLING